MDDETRRALTDRERRIVETVIRLAPAERQSTLLSFMGRAEAGSSCSCGCGSFRILIGGEGANARHSLVAEGSVRRDGLPDLGVMLFATEGRPNYLEIYAPERVDGDPPLKLPSPDDIKG
jgi:hypothetical protein